MAEGWLRIGLASPCGASPAAVLTGPTGAPSGRELEAHGGGRAPTGRALDRDLAAVLLGDPLRDRQTEPSPTTGLVGPKLRQRQAEIARQVFGPYWSSETGKQLTAAERSAYARGRKWRLEALTNPQTREAWRQRGLRRYREGKWHPPAVPPPGAAAKGAARIRELMRDPAYRARFSRRVREAAAARVLVRCAVCDREFEALRHQVARGEKKVCRPECFREYRRRYMAEHNYHQENEDFRRTAEMLTLLDAAAWERLPERERDVTRLYYGLADGRPWRQREIGERLGLRQPSVHRRLHRALANLLGPPGASVTNGGATAD